MEVAEIRARLKRLGMTQADLAARLGVSKAHMSQLLSGKRRMPLDTFRKLEAVFADAETPPRTRGVAETKAAFEPAKRAYTEEEKDIAVKNLRELAEAYRRLPRVTEMTDDEILGYDEHGLPA